MNRHFTDDDGYPTKTYLAAIATAVTEAGLDFDWGHSDVDEDLWFSIRLDDGRLMLTWSAEADGQNADPKAPGAVDRWATTWFDNDDTAEGFHLGTTRAYTTGTLIPEPAAVADLAQQVLRDKIAEAA
ncbi:hypothetical protein [Glycomyces artemisiae]|uniref:Uncharacterized protein n=1 Tax=Glycomyces artemisiae TaxID=1076443 RepID=A0A2T0UEY9_9ACTN|nr:hypothetical protein [Glycomyces artemisiae]PRY56462.1 hypothetical protein B0I28_109111 [Glycomyces artemisiae]